LLTQQHVDCAVRQVPADRDPSMLLLGTDRFISLQSCGGLFSSRCKYSVYGARVPPSLCLCVLRTPGSSCIVWDISKVRMQQNALAGDHASNRMEPVHSFSLAAQMRIKILGESMLDSSTGCSAFLSHLQGHWLQRPVPSLWYDFLFGQGNVRTGAPFFPRSVTSRSAGL
jgi:hypothetical protein